MNFARFAFGLLLGRRLARHAGSSTVACRQSLEIRRDEWGVAYVDAQNEFDAWFGLGFCHAQDRAGQLELSLRLVRGTLASVVGPDGLPIDRAARSIGVHHAAQAQLPTFDADVREQLEAYCAGINAALFAKGASRSHEHVLLRTQPSAWEAADVVALGLMMCCLLPSNWDAELSRLLILTRDGAAAVAALDPAYPAHLGVTFPPGEPAGAMRTDVLLQDLARLREFIGTSGGSNAWAVSAAKTANGHGLLANDPHLPSNLPNVGYLARVRCPDFAVAGVSIVGIPAFLCGHNGHAAWGSTAANVDNTDLFLEELGADGKSVREGERFVACETRSELIAVRGRPSERLDVTLTRRGPIVARSDDPARSLFEPLPLRGRANALSFGATWLRTAPTRALLRAHRVRSFEEFRAACAQSTGCAYSMVYADRASIGWLLAAEVPRRRQGYGSLPMPGWEADSGWEPDVVRSSELPYAENPSAGYVCCANNQPVPDRDGAVFLGHDFLDGYRQQRLSSALAARADWSVESTLALQLDVRSLAWAELGPSVLALAPTEPDARRALVLLAAWDGQVSGDSAAASVYELFLAEMCRKICLARAPNSYQFALGRGVMRLIPGTTFNARRASFVVRSLLERPEGYFESWQDEQLDALAVAVRTLDAKFGEDARGWAWGEVRKLPVTHPFGAKKPLDSVFNLPALKGYGDGGTVNQAGFEFWNPLRHSTVTAHSRAVIEIDDFAASRFVLLGGQSGNPLDPNYASLVPFWQRGVGVPIHWDTDSIRQHAKTLLRLTPRAPICAASQNA